MSYKFKIDFENVRAGFDERCFRSKRELRSFAVGDLTVTLTSASAFVESGEISARYFLCEATRAQQRVFVGYGFVPRRRFATTTAAEVYDAIDQLGEPECCAIAELLDRFGVERMFRHQTLVVASIWESPTPEIAAGVLQSIAKLFRTQTLALDASPLDWEAGPRPDAPAREHISYRRALEKRMPVAVAVAVAGGMAYDVLMYAPPYERTDHEELMALAERTNDAPNDRPGSSTARRFN